MAQTLDSPPRIECSQKDGSIDLGMLAKVMRAEPFTFFTIVFICLGLAVLYLHIAKVRYAVRMEITAASSSDTQKGGGLSALSSIAGISLGGEGSPQFRLFLGSLRSPIAAETIVSDQELLKAIFPREWSQSQGKWVEPPTLVRPLMRVLGWKFAAWGPPGVNRVYDYLNDELKVITDAKSGVVTLEIDTDKPDIGARVLLTLDRAMNERLREHDLEHSTTYIAYLAKRLAEVNVVEYRTALIANLTQEERTRMQASSPLPYASAVLGKPMVSSKPVSPRPFATWGAGLFFGMILGFWGASLKYRRR